jgi:hypothetical protein
MKAILFCQPTLYISEEPSGYLSWISEGPWPTGWKPLL